MRRIVFPFLVVVIICLTCFGTAVLAADEDYAVTPSGIPIDRLAPFVDVFAAQHIGQRTVGATVAVLKDGELALINAYGHADLENEIPAEVGTVFEWGSVSKLLVWTSVMQLVENGRLDLTSDIRSYLPEGFLTKLRFEQPINMLNLMHHNAGWEDHLMDLFYKSADDVGSLEETLRICEPVQVYEPGKVIAYSNFGVSLAGYIVECISGEPFYQYVNEHIFKVLGMDTTTIHPTQQDNAAVAAQREKIHGYRMVAQGSFVKSATERVYVGLYPAGGAMGTIGDAAKFMAALMPSVGQTSPLFADNATLEEMLSTSYSFGGGLFGIAHGFWISPKGVRTLAHGGSTDSFSSYFCFAPEQQLGLMVMTNQNGESAFCRDLANEIFGTYAVPSTSVQMPDTSELEGSYIEARRVHRGFSKIPGLMQMIDIKAIDQHTIDFAGRNYTQISPYIYYSEGNGAFLHFDVQDGKVVQISRQYGCLLPFPQNTMCLLIAGAIFSALSVIWLIAALVIAIIRLVRKIRHKEKTDSIVPAAKWGLFLNLAGIAVIANMAVQVIKAISYATYAELRMFFLFNYAYLICAAIGVALIAVVWKRSGGSKKQRVFAALSGLAAILIAIIIVGFEFYR